MSMNIIWILTGVAVVVGLVALVSYFVRSGANKNSSARPTTTQYDLQDAPPPDSDAAGQAGEQHNLGRPTTTQYDLQDAPPPEQ